VSRTPQLLIGALVIAPWLTITARDTDHANRLGRSHEATAKIGEIIAAVATFHRADGADGRRCPHPPGQNAGSVGPTPPLSVECHRHPSGVCQPYVGDEARGGPGVYPARLWSMTPMWRAIGFRLLDDHAFHYSLTTRDVDGGCVVEVEARADLDGDGEMSRIRARARLSPENAIIDPVWDLHRPLE
jgi:hypothetical protein